MTEETQDVGEGRGKNTNNQAESSENQNLERINEKNVALIWTTDLVDFRINSQLEIPYSSSLLLEHLSTPGVVGNSGEDIRDDATFIENSQVDSLLSEKHDKFLGSTLRFLEEIQERKISAENTFALSSSFSRAIYSSWIELQKKKKLQATEETIPTPTANCVESLLVPTPLSLPSRYFITEAIQNANLKLNSIHSTSSAVLTSFLKSEAGLRLLLENDGHLKTIILEIGEEFISASIISVDADINSKIIEATSSFAKPSVLSSKKISRENSFADGICFEDGFISRVSEKNLARFRSYSNMSTTSLQGLNAKNPSQKDLFSDLLSNGIPEGEAIFDSMQLTVESTEGSMNFGFKEMDEQLIEDWISSLLHLSKIQSASYLAKRGAKDDPSHLDYDPTPMYELINTNDGFNVWKKVPLKDRLLCLRAMKLFRQCLGNYYSDLSHLPEETKNVPVHDLAASFDKTIVEFMSFLRSHHDIHANYRDYSQRRKPVQTQPKPTVPLRTPSSLSYPAAENNEEQRNNDILDASELDDIPEENNDEIGENEVKEEDADNGDEINQRESAHSPVSPRPLSEKGSEKSDAHDWQESFTPSINDLLEYLHDFVYEKTDRYIKVLTPWMKQQSFFIFQQLLEQYGEDKMIIEVYSYQPKQSTPNATDQQQPHNKKLFFLIDTDFTPDTLNQSMNGENNNSILQPNSSNPSFSSPLSSAGNLSTSLLSSTSNSTLNNGRVRKSWKAYFINLLKDCFYNFVEKEQSSTRNNESEEKKTILPHHFQGLLLWQENANNLGFHALLELLEKELVAFHERQAEDQALQPQQQNFEQEEEGYYQLDENGEAQDYPVIIDEPCSAQQAPVVREVRNEENVLVAPIPLSASQSDLLLQPQPKRTPMFIEDLHDRMDDEDEEDDDEDPFPSSPKNIPSLNLTSIHFAEEIEQSFPAPESPKATSSSSSSTEEIISKIYLPREHIYYLPPVAVHDGCDILLLSSISKEEQSLDNEKESKEEIKINENPFQLSNQSKLGISWMRLLTKTNPDDNEKELIQPILTSKDVQNIFWFEPLTSLTENSPKLSENKQEETPKSPIASKVSFNLGLSLSSPNSSFLQQPQSQSVPTSPTAKKENGPVLANQSYLSNYISKSLASNQLVYLLIDREEENDDDNDVNAIYFQLVTLEYLENPSISSFSKPTKSSSSFKRPRSARKDGNSSRSGTETDENDPIDDNDYLLFTRQDEKFYQIKHLQFPPEMNASSSFTLLWKRANIRAERKRNSVSTSSLIDPSLTQQKGKDFLFLVWNSSTDSDLLEESTEKINILSWIPLPSIESLLGENNHENQNNNSNNSQMLYSLGWNGNQGKLFEFLNLPLISMDQFQKELEARLFQQLIDKKLQKLEEEMKLEEQQRKRNPKRNKIDEEEGKEGEENEEEKKEHKYYLLGFGIPSKYVHLVFIIYGLLFASKCFSYLNRGKLFSTSLSSSSSASSPTIFDQYANEPTRKSPRQDRDRNSEEFQKLPEILQREDDLLSMLPPPVADPEFDLSSLFSHIDSIRDEVIAVHGEIDPSTFSPPSPPLPSQEGEAVKVESKDQLEDTREKSVDSPDKVLSSSSSIESSIPATHEEKEHPAEKVADLTTVKAVPAAKEKESCELCDEDDDHPPATNERAAGEGEGEEGSGLLATVSKFLMVYVFLFGLILIFLLTLKPTSLPEEDSPSSTAAADSAPKNPLPPQTTTAGDGDM